MALLKLELNTMEDLFLEQIEDLYDAEIRLIDALPKMAEAASSPQLESAFREHLTQTEGHVRRLEQVFEMFDKVPNRETCEGMKGLIQEGEQMVKAKGEAAVKDAALIAAAQRVEHYEIAGYGTARTLAQHLGNEAAAELLQATLNEEGDADHKLTHLAEQSVNVQAARY